MYSTILSEVQPALDTDEEEQAARYESYRLEDERDAELKVDIGMGGMSRR